MFLECSCIASFIFEKFETFFMELSQFFFSKQYIFFGFGERDVDILTTYLIYITNIKILHL